MSKNPRRVAVMLDLVWPYKRHAAVFAGMQQYAESHGWHSIIDEFAHNTLQTRHGIPLAYDGIIARANPQLVTQAARCGIPLVNVFPSLKNRHLVPGVYPDGKEVGRLCAEHFLARGFRNFATLTSPQNRTEELAVSEFVRTAKLAGFATDTALIPQRPELNLAHWRKTERIIDRWMHHWQRPIGVYVGQEPIGRLVVQLCHERGWRVPEDVAIIAGQNQETFCEFPRPSLTSMEMGYERIGFEAARLLDRLMDGEPPPVESILLPPQGLVVRESTDFFAVDDKLVAASLVFISANSHRRIGPDDVARAVGAETRTLQNYFRRVLQRPVATEIRRVRIERAKRELAQSQRPLAEIAHDVGFGNIQQLYIVFLREVGIAPSDYRKQRMLEKRI
ncbi:hypothetical protein BH11PLA2_BH11PLA2_20520 [soil metagenome]